MSTQFAKWQPLDAKHVDCEALRMSQFAQSAATKSGKVPEFKLLNIMRTGGEKPRIRITIPAPYPQVQMTTQPIEACHNPAETPIRERAYAPGQSHEESK